jgi:hypothetical protein
VLPGDSLWFPFSPRWATGGASAGEQTGRPADGAGGGASGGASGGAGTRRQADRGGAPLAVRGEAAGGQGRRSTGGAGARRQADQGRRWSGSQGRYGRWIKPSGARLRVAAGPPELRIRRGVGWILPPAARTALARTER